MTARHPPAARRAGHPSAVRLLQSVALSAAMFWFPATPLLVAEENICGVAICGVALDSRSFVVRVPPWIELL